jgi:hypothetical protein
VIASGKCSNAPEFEPFAARLNRETMLYELDTDFDLESWRQEINAGSNSTVLRPGILRELLQRGREYEKKQIVEIIRQEKGIGNSRAYELVDQAKTRRVLRFNKVMKTYALV